MAGKAQSGRAGRRVPAGSHAWKTSATSRPTTNRVVRRIVSRWGHDPTGLVQILREVHEAFGCLPGPALALVARLLRIPYSRAKGVASFYAFLNEEPLGSYRVLFSDNITDRMAGSERLMDSMCHRLWVEPGKVSEDGLVSVARTSCTGLCDQGPALLVNGRAIAALTDERIAEICRLILARTELGDWPAEFFEVHDHVRRADILLGHALKPGDAIRAALQRGARGWSEHAANERSWREAYVGAAQGPIAMLEEVKRSNLRGRGGAGFTTGIKWEACRHATGLAHYVVCNADEGEPGTFKDRVLLASYPDLVFDGMTVAAYAIGASQGFLYLRGEYRYLLESLEATLERRRAANLLGNGIAGQAGFDFDIRIHVGAGSYVCGEESALIESLEGKRGVPRNRPPYPVTNGYKQQPTIVNNVETLCAAALIAVHGGDWYRSLGTLKSSGTKILSVAGDVARPGLYEYPVRRHGAPGAGGLRRDGARRPCRSAGRPACASTPPSSTAASPSRTCPRPARSRCSTRAATCSRWRATTRSSSRTRAAASARRAGSAPRCWWRRWTRSTPATARSTSCAR